MKSPEESYRLEVVSDPYVSGNFAYFTLNWIEDGEYRSSIYRFNGEKVDRVTFGGHEKMPSFFNGKFHYVSYTKKKESLMLQEEFKEPREIFSNESIQKYLYHKNTPIVMTQDASNEEEPFITDRLKYRFDTKGYLRTRVRLVALEDSPRNLVSGDFDVVDFDSNGKVVIFSATIEDDDRGLQDIYELNVADSSYRRLTSGSGEAPLVSVNLDGEIAYIGHRNGISPWTPSSLVFPGTDRTIGIGKNAGNTVNSDLFVPGSNSLLLDNGKYFLIGQEGGKSHIYAYDGDEVLKITDGNISVRAFHVNDGKVAYVYSSPERPSVLVFKGEYDPNPDFRGRKPMRIEVNGMEAWLIESSKENPTVLAVHGGPQTAYGYAYSIEFNFLADNGYNVLYGNPRGSDGYGEDFAEGCVGDWGGKDFEDLLGFVDASMKELGLSDNFAITGGSYGGYMTNAAIVKTDRFKCAISERCVSNLMSMCGTSDIGFWFNAIESSVDDPWSEDGIRRLLELSPVTRAKNVRTPTMFVHGENDYRCPIEQSEQMYNAIRMNGVDTLLARYPGDTHEHARRGIPENMKDRLKRKLSWFDTYMKKKRRDE